MRKTLLATVVAVAAGLVLAPTASAHLSGTFGGNAFDTACTTSGGTLAGSGSGKTCTHTALVPGSVDVLEAGQSGNAWTVHFATSETHVSTWRSAAAQVDHVVTPGATFVLGCTNPGGHAMSFDHRNCQLP